MKIGTGLEQSCNLIENSAFFLCFLAMYMNVRHCVYMNHSTVKKQSSKENYLMLELLKFGASKPNSCNRLDVIWSIFLDVV
jgi:hypothetical protein